MTVNKSNTNQELKEILENQNKILLQLSQNSKQILFYKRKKRIKSFLFFLIIIFIFYYFKIPGFLIDCYINFHYFLEIFNKLVFFNESISIKNTMQQLTENINTNQTDIKQIITNQESLSENINKNQTFQNTMQQFFKLIDTNQTIKNTMQQLTENINTNQTDIKQIITNNQDLLCKNQNISKDFYSQLKVIKNDTQHLLNIQQQLTENINTINNFQNNLQQSFTDVCKEFSEGNSTTHSDIKQLLVNQEQILNKLNTNQQQIFAKINIIQEQINTKLNIMNNNQPTNLDVLESTFKVPIKLW